MRELHRAANLTLVEFSNRQPNLWEVGLTSTSLVVGTGTYTLNANVVMILDAYISDGTTDQIITPISRTEYAAYPNKTQAGSPVVYWFNRQATPTITLWPVPDDATETLNFYSVRQTQDANLASGENVEVPYRWLDAFVASLAWRLAEIYRPDVEQNMLTKAERAWRYAAEQDTENTPLYIYPQLGKYFD
jgi:hypothetical protein